MVNVALLLTVLTLRAWHWCLPPGELHSPGHCIHSMHYEHNRFGLRRLVEIDTTKGTERVAKRDRFGRRSTVRTPAHELHRRPNLPQKPTRVLTMTKRYRGSHRARPLRVMASPEAVIVPESCELTVMYKVVPCFGESSLLVFCFVELLLKWHMWTILVVVHRLARALSLCSPRSALTPLSLTLCYCALWGFARNSRGSERITNS